MIVPFLPFYPDRALFGRDGILSNAKDCASPGLDRLSAVAHRYSTLARVVVQGGVYSVRLGRVDVASAHSAELCADRLESTMRRKM